MRHSHFYFLLGFVVLAPCACQKHKEGSAAKKLNDPVASLYDSTLKPFYHGVASGDPLIDRVIIWTRVTPEDSVASIPVQWEISESENFRAVLRSDTTSASALRDYTVKVDVTGLSPAKYYYYRFKALDRTSATGRTKTIPQNDSDSLKFAVVSCSNWEFGYFNACSRIAEKQVDAVLHLGDYIYEYAEGRYGNKNVDRKNLPDHEVVSLQDYRTRYSQYHTDKGLRDMRMRHPLIAIWDDHEVANNVYASGAQNHQPDKEGDFDARKKAAKQAYYEWIPIRESDKHYRSFPFGNLATLIMLDERLEGRTKPLDSVSDPSFNEKDRAILGPEQLVWFESQLKSSQATWKIIGNQVIFSDVDQSLISPKNPKNLDSWDGYPAEKKSIADFIRQNKLSNLVFLSGDSHASWAFEVSLDPSRTYNKNNSKGALAVEFGVTSISSANSNEYASDDTVRMEEANLLKSNPHLKYTNHRDHGYLLLTLFPQKAKGEWYFIETLLKPDEGEHLGKKLEVEKGQNHLK
jgi:alkaline phosphatase D